LNYGLNTPIIDPHLVQVTALIVTANVRFSIEKTLEPHFGHTGLDNIRIGISVAARMLKDGFSPYTPFLDFQFCLHLPRESYSIENFYRCSADFLRSCDAIFIVSNPRNAESRGAKEEIEIAARNGMPVFHDYDKLLDWARVPVAL